MLAELAAGVGGLLALLAAAWAGIRAVARSEIDIATEPYTLRYEIWPNEPWRTRPDAASIAVLPTWWLYSVADPAELAGAASHDYRLGGLVGSIREDGIHTPLVVNIDQLGRACLADGHHRLVVAAELNIGACPVQIRAVSRIGGYGVPVGPAVARLVTQARNQEGAAVPALRR